nr:alpha/beta hydrolase [Candidatus Sigynarchaeota archaeon]
MQNLNGIIRHGFADVGGTKLHYVEAGWNNERSIVFLHGFPDFWFSWRHQIPFFAGDYHVIAIDQRGCNLSGKPARVSDYSVDFLVLDVKKLADHLGLHKFVLAGHDWGGAVAWEFANRHPNCLDSLIILNCPPVQLLMAEQLKNARQLKSSYYIYLFQVPWLPERVLTLNNANMLARMLSYMIPSITPQELAIYRDGLGQIRTLRSAINYYRCAFRRFLPRLLSGNMESVDIRCPVFVIWGVEDIALQTSLTTRFPKVCSAGYKISYVNAGHFVHQDKPALVNRLIDAYIKNQPS